MSTLFQITILILGAGVMIVLFLKNRSLADKLEVCQGEALLEAGHAANLERELESLNEKYEELVESEQNYYEENRRLREGIAMRDANNVKALQERDAAMMHLEKTLAADVANRVVPNRISCEIGMDGVYYSLSYDSPEMAEVTPMPHLTGSANT